MTAAADIPSGVSVMKKRKLFKYYWIIDHVTDNATGLRVLEITTVRHEHHTNIGAGKVLMRHMITMKYLGLRIAEKDQRILENYDFHRTFYQNCLQEIKNTEEEKFYDDGSV